MKYLVEPAIGTHVVTDVRIVKTKKNRVDYVNCRGVTGRLYHGQSHGYLTDSTDNINHDWRWSDESSELVIERALELDEGLSEAVTGLIDSGKTKFEIVGIIRKKLKQMRKDGKL